MTIICTLAVFLQLTCTWRVVKVCIAQTHWTSVMEFENISDDIKNIIQSKREKFTLVGQMVQMITGSRVKETWSNSYMKVSIWKMPFPCCYWFANFIVFLWAWCEVLLWPMTHPIHCTSVYPALKILPFENLHWNRYCLEITKFPWFRTTIFV